MSPRDDRGAVAPLVLALVGVLVVCALALGLVVELVAARQRAADVADLAALAAVSSLLPDEARACDDATWVVRRNGGELVSCAFSDGDATVVVAQPLRGPFSDLLARLLGGPPAPRAHARAGRR